MIFRGANDTPHLMDHSVIACSNLIFDSNISQTFKSSVAVGVKDLLNLEVIFSTYVEFTQLLFSNSIGCESLGSIYSLLAQSFSTWSISLQDLALQFIYYFLAAHDHLIIVIIITAFLYRIITLISILTLVLDASRMLQLLNEYSAS